MINNSVVPIFGSPIIQKRKDHGLDRLSEQRQTHTPVCSLGSGNQVTGGSCTDILL